MLEVKRSISCLSTLKSRISLLKRKSLEGKFLLSIFLLLIEHLMSLFLKNYSIIVGVFVYLCVNWFVIPNYSNLNPFPSLCASLSICNQIFILLFLYFFIYLWAEWGEGVDVFTLKREREFFSSRFNSQLRVVIFIHCMSDNKKIFTGWIYLLSVLTMHDSVEFFALSVLSTLKKTFNW